MENEKRKYLTRNERISREFREKYRAEEKEPPKDFMLSLVFTRFILFSLLVLLIFAVGKGGTKLYMDLKTAYQSIMEEDMGKEELKETLSHWTQYIEEKMPKETSLYNFAVSNFYNGMGGEDAPFYGKNASFAPIFITEPFHKPVEFKRVSSSFGQRENPITHKNGFHTGIDLAAPMYTPIYAAFSGKVKKIGESKGRGKYIVLEHGNGLSTIYCHCNEIFATEGLKLNGGEKIAEVGATGQATGPHLHFEVQLHEVAYNPSWLLFNDGTDS